MVAGFSVPAPTSVLNGCTIMQPRSVQYFVSAISASCMVSTTNLMPSSGGGYRSRSLFAPPGCYSMQDHQCAGSPPDGTTRSAGHQGRGGFMVTWMISLPQCDGQLVCARGRERPQLGRLTAPQCPFQVTDGAVDITGC